MIPGRHSVNSKRLQRGATLLEAMIAMGVLLVGAAGLIGLQRQTMLFMADSRQATRAACFAQDLASQIELWDYADTRLANTNTANDADPTAGMETDVGSSSWVTPDHSDAEIPDTDPNWTGLKSDMLVANGMERYWNVSSGDDLNANGVADALRVAIIVRWRPGGARSWRYATFFVVKPNPADML